MVGWREKKRAMLADVHKHFEVPAVYLTHATGNPVRVTVRVHRKQIAERPPIGSSDEVAGMLDIHDRIIFQKAQLPIVPEGVLSKAYVIVSSSEAYFTGPSKPERDGYLWVEVTELSQSDLTALLGLVDLTNPAWAGIAL